MEFLCTHLVCPNTLGGCLLSLCRGGECTSRGICTRSAFWSLRSAPGPGLCSRLTFGMSGIVEGAWARPRRLAAISGLSRRSIGILNFWRHLCLRRSELGRSWFRMFAWVQPDLGPCRSERRILWPHFSSYSQKVFSVCPSPAPSTPRARPSSGNSESAPELPPILHFLNSSWDSNCPFECWARPSAVWIPTPSASTAHDYQGDCLYSSIASFLPV